MPLNLDDLDKYAQEHLVPKTMDAFFTQSPVFMRLLGETVSSSSSVPMFPPGFRFAPLPELPVHIQANEPQAAAKPKRAEVLDFPTERKITFQKEGDK